MRLFGSPSLDICTHNSCSSDSFKVVTGPHAWTQSFQISAGEEQWALEIGTPCLAGAESRHLKRHHGKHLREARAGLQQRECNGDLRRENLMTEPQTSKSSLPSLPWQVALFSHERLGWKRRDSEAFGSL